MKVHYFTWVDGAGVFAGAESVVYFYNPNKWIISYINNQSLLEREKKDLEIMQERLEILTKKTKVKDNEFFKIMDWKYNGQVDLPDELIEKVFPLWGIHEDLMKLDKGVKEVFTDGIKSLVELVKKV